jgi:Tol biopolymer transport system component
LRQLTSDIRNDQGYAWSPDGRWIAFRSDRGGQWDLWIVAASGGAAMRVTDDLAVEGVPEWSADATTLYYNRFDTQADLRVMAADGAAAPRTLVSWTGYQIGNAVISPDGQTVLFQSNRSGNPDIWSVPFAGGEPAPYAVSPLVDGAPQFSPDGSVVAFQSDRAGSLDLWVMPAAGGEARRLTEWPSTEENPVFSPSGAQIAFVSNHDGAQLDVWVVPVAGGEPRRLTTGASNVGGLAWSPDEQSIYYVGGTADGQRDLYRVGVSGGRPQALGASAGIGFGALSPDGSHYAYSTYEGGWAFVEVLATAGGPPRRLTTRTERVYQNVVEWSPDGTRIIVQEYDFTNDKNHIAALTWPDGARVPLTDSPESSNIFQDHSPDGSEILFGIFVNQSSIMSVAVAGLLSGR